MTQLHFPHTGREVDVDGHVDARGIRYIGKAVKLYDGSWRCLADVCGNLCRVEVTLRDEEGRCL